jgi:hypothetical protein
MTVGESIVHRYEGAPLAAHLMIRDIDSAIRAAVEAERERCADELEKFAKELDTEADGESLMGSQQLYGRADGVRLAAAITRGCTPSTATVGIHES